MTEEERDNLATFCANARLDIEGYNLGDEHFDELYPKEYARYIAMNDDELFRESRWLDELLGK